MKVAALTFALALAGGPGTDVVPHAQSPTVTLVEDAVAACMREPTPEPPRGVLNLADECRDRVHDACLGHDLLKATLEILAPCLPVTEDVWRKHVEPMFLQTKIQAIALDNQNDLQFGSENEASILDERAGWDAKMRVLACGEADERTRIVRLFFCERATVRYVFSLRENLDIFAFIRTEMLRRQTGSQPESADTVNP